MAFESHAKLVCRVNGATDWYPVLEVSESGVQGAAASVLADFAADYEDVRFEFGNAQPWVRTELQLSEGQLDLIAGAYFNAKRDREFLYSAPFHSEKIHLFVTPEHLFDYTRMEELVGLVGIRPAGGSYGERFDRFAAEHLDLQEVFDSATMLRMLLNGRADYLILAKMNGLQFIKKYGLQREVLMLPQPVVENGVHFLFNRNSPCAGLRNALNRFIAQRLVRAN